MASAASGGDSICDPRRSAVGSGRVIASTLRTDAVRSWPHRCGRGAMFRAATERTLIVAAAFRLRVLLWTIRNRIELPVAGWTRRPRDGRMGHGRAIGAMLDRYPYRFDTYVPGPVGMQFRYTATARTSSCRCTGVTPRSCEPGLAWVPAPRHPSRPPGRGA